MRSPSRNTSLDATTRRLVLVAPIRFGPAVEVWRARLGGQEVLARRYIPDGPPPGWPAPPDPDVLHRMNHRHLQRFLGEFRDETGARIQVFSWHPGETVGDLLRAKTRLPHRKVLVVLRHAARGLSWLHERGPASPLLHGDVSPDNLLVTPRHCRWLDVLAIRPGTHPGGPGVVYGTLPCLAPEVLEGAPLTLAAEVFSLGLVALWALCRRLPWAQAPSPSEVLAHHARKPPHSLLPDDLEWPDPALAALRAMLAVDPSQRPTVGDVVEALRAAAIDDGDRSGITFSPGS